MDEFLKELYRRTYNWDPDNLIGKQVIVGIDPGVSNGKVRHYEFEEELMGYNYEESLEADERLRGELEGRRAQKLYEKKIALVDQYGEDNFENGTILKFGKLFDKSDTYYNYAVLKTNNQWYSTGKILNFVRGSWESLVLALVGGKFPVHLEDVIILLPEDGKTNRALSKAPKDERPILSLFDESDLRETHPFE